MVYGVACEATDHAIYYGPLTHADLAAYAYSGALCSIGRSGAYAGFDPPLQDFFFLVVGHDDVVEGSYGTSWDGAISAERPPALPTVMCPAPQDLTDRCDQ